MSSALSTVRPQPLHTDPRLSLRHVSLLVCVISFLLHGEGRVKDGDLGDDTVPRSSALPSPSVSR